MESNQSQKNGDNGINQAVNGSGIAINNNGVINYAACSNEKDIGIIGEILEGIFNSESVQSSVDDIKNSDRILPLKEKIPLNFDKDQEGEVGGMFLSCWDKIQIVEKFIETNYGLSSDRVSALIVQLKAIYKKIKVCQSSEERIGQNQILEKVALELLPESKQSNPDYFANSLAIILFFFERCEIGTKTTKEEAVRVNIFK